MARLRLVGRPGRRFGNKGLRYADGGRSSSDRGDAPKGRLVVSVHRGLRDFVAIAGGDSDDEEDFLGFTEDEILLVIKKTSDLLALVKTSEDVAEPSVEEIGGRLRQRLQKTTAKPFLQLVKSRYMRNSFLTMMPQAAMKRQHVRSLCSQTAAETSLKPMKGSIKVRLFGKGFLLNAVNRPVWSKEKRKPREDKNPPITTPPKPLHKEKPSARPAPVKVIAAKTVGRSAKELLLKKEKRLIKHSRVEVKYQLADNKRRLKDKGTEPSPKKAAGAERRDLLPAKKMNKAFMDLKTGSKTLNKQVKRMSKYGEKHGRVEAKSLSSDSNHSQRKTTAAGKRFLQDTNSSLEPLVKIPRLCETGFENSSKKEDIAGGNISSNELGNLSFSRFPENKNLSADVPKKIPMFEAPLICDSKRHRRPAQKLIMKLSEDYEMSLKRSRRSLDSMATGGEMSSGDEKYDTSPKSTKNNRTGQCRAVIPGDDKYQDHLAASKGSRDVGEAGGDRKSIWPVLSSSSSVLVQKNKDIAGGQSEGEDSKGARWRRRSCCVCSGTYKLSRYAGCRVLCCRHCFRFYSSKAKLVMKGSLDLLCVSGGCCSVDWRTVSGCDACRYRRCLQYFPQPEVVISLNSAHKSDSVRQERPQSEFPLAPIAKDSLWNAELLKFLKASQAQEAALGFEVDSKAASLTSESSLGPAASTGPSRRLCKLGKSRTAARMSDTFHELVDHSGTSLPDSSGLRSDSFSTVNSLTYGDKSGAADTRDELKSNEVFRCRTLGAKESTREPLIKCDVKSSCPDALNGGRFSEGPSFYEGQVAALSAEGALQQQSPRKFGGKAPEVEGIDEGTVSEGSERRGDSKGPRIKHVCRKAAVVLGKPEAVFPPRTGLCLSALPSQEKERLFQVEDNSQDSMDVDGTSRIAEDQETNSEKLNLSSKRSSGANAKSPGRLGGPKKTMRCKNCVGCLTPECGVCTACKDMPKNGGRGTLKHACIHRVCRNPILPWHKLSPEKLAKAQLEKEVVEAKRKKITVSRLQTSSAFSRPRGRGRPRLSLVSGKKFQSKLGSISGSAHVMSKVRQLRIPKASAGVDDKFEKNPLANKSSSEQPVLPLTVNVDFNESTDIEDAWKRGLALYSLSSGSLRAACRLCASAGLQELIYCSVCCQPFHSFCLEERDRPKEGCDTWCCLQCQFCHVCYGQSNLLQCDKCQESYHPDCLGPNYPTKPSRRKHIWICSKCVRCRSCGATTPGHEKDATWMCDFSLCYSCGLLMEKGNFCPVCHKCYTDDDWESQLIQCFTCHSWVHSKCEELTDEMYQIVTYMPEDVPFNCRVCCPTRPSVWEILIQQEMQRGMKSVLDALVQCKSSSMLESFQSVRKLGVQETDFATLESSGDGCMAAKQQSSEFPGNSKTVCSDEPQQINSFAKDPENRNPNTSMNPLNLIDSEAVSHSLSLPAVPVVGIADGGSVEPTETLKDVELNGTSGISTDGHLSSAEGKEEKEINAKNITDCQTPILGLTDAMLTASALDNVSSRPNSSSSADGKLRSLLQSGSKFNDYKDLYKDVPHDLMEIKAKLDKENGYTTIESFVADVTRIIRYNMVLKAEEANPLQTGACSAVHSLFIKQMENCFPWFNVKNSRCLSATSQSPKNGVVDQAVHPPSMDHTYAHYLEKEVMPSPPQPSLFRSTARDCGPHFGNTVKKGEADEETFSGRPEDVRCCAFCWTYGDADEEEAGRLVSAGQDDWVHVNCALWSAEVYEEIDGTLQMVHAALARSRKLRCDLCGKPGATVGCCQQGCNSNFHFTCARRKNCAFLETKKVFCELHWMAVDADLIADGNFAVNRRICINPTSARWTKRQWVVGVDPSTINVLIGSLSVDSLGHLSPLSDSKSALLPIDFCVSRLFWSTEDPRQRCIYVCRIVEVTPKAKSPEIISDITVIHDRNDPCYDVQLAKSFTAKDVASDESTLSAFEDDLDLSGSEAEAFAMKLPNITREREESLLNLSHAHEKDIHSVNDEGVLGYPYQSVLDRRHPKWMHLEMQRQESLKMLRSDASSESSLPLTSSDYSQLSASTLRMLGLRSNALNAQSTSVDSKDDSDDEMMLVKIASRLNEAAAKNRRQEFHKRLHEGNGSNSTEVSMSSLDAESTDETSRFGNDTREPETVVARNLVQTDGPPGESDSEDGGSEDFNLVADFSSEDESSRRGRGSSRTLSVEERSLPFNSHTTGNECISSNEDCIYSSAPVDSTVQSVSVDDLKKISDGLLSTDCHLVNDYARTGTSEASLQLPLSSASVQSASTVMPTMSAVESGKNFVAEGAASGVLSFQNPAEIGDGSLRPVVTSCGVQFALSRLLNANDVSYLGSVALSAANPTRLQQVINNLQFPVDPSKAPSPSGSNQHSPGLPSIAPVSFGVSNPPQIQVATPSSNITPQILKSLQQMLGTSQSSKPFFFKLRNSSPSELPPTSMVASSAFPSSLSGAHGPPSCAVLPSPTVTLFNQNVVSAIPLYASSQAVPSTGPVISGLKRHLSSNEDIDSKRIRLASSGGLALSRLAAEGHTIGSSCPVESGPRGCAVSGDGLRDLSPLHSNRGSKDLQKKSHIRMPGSHRSSNDLSNVLSDVNHSKGQAEKRGAQKVPSVINRKSKPEPVFDPHPMFRPHLPEAEVEEEIENSPLLAMLENEEQRLKDEAEHVESTPHLMFEITNNSGFCVQADSLNKAWKAVTDRVQDARLSVGMKPVSFVGVNGLYMTGLDHPAVVYLVEQLPGFKRFHNYKFKYHPPQLDEDDEVIENPHGCARAEQFAGQNKCETFSFLLSRYRSRPEYDPNTAYEENIMANKSQRRSTSLDLPMAMRFRHLRIFAKEAVGVYRSNIHGRGLFCRRDIDAGEMIIEYSGEVIRAILTDKREKRYESKAMGCYMFRKDRDHVIDSTMMGNAARFINHSCDPNCYSKVILVDNRKHIVIFAQRPIRRGEELTYDYKFPIEDVKIPCTCGSRRCRKYLN